MKKGIYTALVTPFSKGVIDYTSLDQLCSQQIKNGVSGLVILGTTGENPTITGKERAELLSHILEYCNGKIDIIVGTGTNNTKETVERTIEAKKMGADMAMIVNPYYNKPNQEGLKKHFLSVADACDIDLMLYNIQGRTGVNVLPTTIFELMKHPKIVAIKEASGDVSQILEMIDGCGEEMHVYVGDDALTIPMMMMGAWGCVSVASNLIPKNMVEMSEAVLNKNYELARKNHYNWSELFSTLFIDTNPCVVKKAMKYCNIIANDEVRLPLTTISNKTDDVLKKTLKKYSLI